MASRTFTRSADKSTVTVRDTPPPRRQPNVGPGGGTSAPPESNHGPQGQGDAGGARPGAEPARSREPGRDGG